MSARHAHLIPQQKLAAVQRLCDTEAVGEAASDAGIDTGSSDFLPVGAAIQLKLLNRWLVS
jgi:hypothetical protein